MIPTVATTIIGPSHIPLYIETYGDPSHPQTLFLIHGALQSLRCFHQQFAALSEHAYVIALDLPYHGQSGPVPTSVQPTPALWVNSVRAVLTQLDRLNHPCTFLSWSFGGLVTRHYLQLYGAQGINGVILVASLFSGMQTYQRFQEPLAAQAMSTMSNQHVILSERIRAFEQFVTMLTKRPLPTSERDSQYGYNAKAFLHSLAVVDQWSTELPCDEQQFFRHLSMPVLLIQGQDDALVPVAYTRHVAGALPHAQLLEYEDCGHALFLEQPERFNQDVLSFLRGGTATSDSFKNVA